MMTFKELKKLVKLPLYKEQRVPTVKALEESGVSVVAEKILENHGSISVYQNGYVIYRAHKRVTVFSLRNCVHYKYDALEGAGHHIEEEEFDECRAFCFLRMGKEETVRCQSAIRIRPAACKKSIDLIFRDKDFLRIPLKALSCLIGLIREGELLKSFRHLIRAVELHPHHTFIFGVGFCQS